MIQCAGLRTIMVYRQTDKVKRRLAERHAALIEASYAIAAKSGMAAVQIAPVAAQAGIAAGTVYRYFPAKTDLVAALVRSVSRRELEAVRHAADNAPGPLSALAAAIITFAARAAANRRLAWAVLAEPVDPEIDFLRVAYRKALAAEFEQRISAAIESGSLPEQDVGITAPALVGALLEGLLGPLAPKISPDVDALRDEVRALALIALRAAGVADARARGLVVQTAWPAVTEQVA